MPPLIREIDSSKKSARIDAGPYVNILQIIDKKYPSSERGDVLVFLNGISEISIVADACKEYGNFTKKWIVLILHSTLSVEEQQKVANLMELEEKSM
jgi:HrpA-like RNA helicase